MFYTEIFILCLFLFIFLYNFNIFFDVNLISHYNRWITLNSVVRQQHNNKYKAFFVSIYILLQKTYIQLLNSRYQHSKHVVRISHDIYLVNYSIKGKKYKFITHFRRSIPKITQVITNEGNDITSEVYSYMGPSQNWHCMHELTPVLIGYDCLIFKMFNGDEIKIHNKENIIPIINKYV